MPQSKSVLVEFGEGLSVLVGLPTIPSWNIRTRPKKPKIGAIGFNSQTNNLEYWDGKSWFAAPMS